MCEKTRTMRIHTPIGDLLVEGGETNKAYYMAVALERKDGEVIDLTEADIKKQDSSAVVSVWNDTSTDQWTDEFFISNNDLMIKVE